MTLERSSLYFPITDSQGDLTPNIQVRFYEPGTTTPVNGSLYASATGSFQLTQPVEYGSGIIVAYSPLPMRVRVGVTVGSQAEFYFDDVDFKAPGDNTVVADQVTYIKGQPSQGEVLTAAGDGSLYYTTPPGVTTIDPDDPSTVPSVIYIKDASDVVYGIYVLGGQLELVQYGSQAEQPYPSSHTYPSSSLYPD